MPGYKRHTLRSLARADNGLESLGGILCAPPQPQPYLGQGKARTSNMVFGTIHRDYSEYRVRDDSLRDMEYANYRAYLMSPLWRSIRNRVLKENGQCFKCGGKAQCIHHMSYSVSVMRGERLSELVPLCNACHESAEVNSFGEKRTLAEANAWLNGAGVPRANPRPKAKRKVNKASSLQPDPLAGHPKKYVAVPGLISPKRAAKMNRRAAWKAYAGDNRPDLCCAKCKKPKIKERSPFKVCRACWNKWRKRAGVDETCQLKYAKRIGKPDVAGVVCGGKA